MGRPNLLLPATACVGSLFGMAAGVALAVGAVSAGDYHLAVMWLALAGLLIKPLTSWLPVLRDVYALLRGGLASYAIADDRLFIIDGVGNAVIVELSEVTGLILDGEEARLRTDSELQGTIYAVMFDLFDDDGHGPDADRFFETLAPRLRSSCPQATIVRHTVGEGALM